MFHDTPLRRAAALAIPITLGAWTVQAADIIETAKQDGRFDGFVYLLEAAGMVEMLRGEGPFTIFAPTDEALSPLPLGMLEWLLADENREPREIIIQAHVIAGAAIRTRDLSGRAVEVATVGGGALAIDGTTAVILLAPLEVTITEVEAQGGREEKGMIVPVVDMPQDPMADADRLASVAGDVAMVVEPDIEADNGVIHGIDSVLLPPEMLWWFWSSWPRRSMWW
jgi:uncharacterized surface protein with fasciclin (FAS1) repeats